MSPEGAAVNSQGRKPLERRTTPNTQCPSSPEGATDAHPRTSSVPQILLVVCDSLPVEKRDELFLKGHRAMMFEFMDAWGLSRYLPILIYVKGDLGKSAFISHRAERYELQNQPAWTETVDQTSSGSVDAR